MSKFSKTLFSISIITLTTLVLIGTITVAIKSATAIQHTTHHTSDVITVTPHQTNADNLVRFIAEQPNAAHTISLALSPDSVDAYANTTNVITDFPDPIMRLGHSIYINCPATLEVQDPSSGEWREADYLEPEFEVMPDNVLWVVEPDRNYRMTVDFGNRIAYLKYPKHYGQDTDDAYYHSPAASTFETYVTYTGNALPGTLGTFRVELDERIGDVVVIYRGELKFVADNGANLYCSNASMDFNGNFTVDLQPRTTDSQFQYQQFTIDSPFSPQLNVHTVLDSNQPTVYSTNLADYLYPRGVPEELEWYFDQFPLPDEPDNTQQPNTLPNATTLPDSNSIMPELILVTD